MEQFHSLCTENFSVWYGIPSQEPEMQVTCIGCNLDDTIFIVGALQSFKYYSCNDLHSMICGVASSVHPSYLGDQVQHMPPNSVALLPPSP